MNVFQPAQATEGRPEIAHGKTVGKTTKRIKPRPGRHKINSRISPFAPAGACFVFGLNPTVSPWATVCRAAGAVLAALVLFLALGARAETTNALSDAEIKGRELAQQLCDTRPITNLIQTGTLIIRDANGGRTNIPVKFKTEVFTKYWESKYEASLNSSTKHGTWVRTEELFVTHLSNLTNNYFHYASFDGEQGSVLPVRGDTPFAGSDFWIADLGLEFFHWPAQKILPKTTNLKRGREYTLLESTNPNPSTNGYSRVLSWIDKESGGILQAEAYDARGKLLKVFEPKSFKKVNGQWELQEMEIRNVQTGSRTRLEFDLNKQ
jgi:hypothetical protein